MLPDLLHDQAIATLNLEKTDRDLVFAFAGHPSGSLFGDALDAASVAPSSFQANAFSGDLFVPTFVRKCFEIRLGNQPRQLATKRLCRLLCAPPRRRASLDFRRDITGELLSHPELRETATKLYQKLTLLRGCLELSSADGSAPVVRQIEILQAFRDVVLFLSTHFGGAKSGLARLQQYGHQVAASDEFRALADLLSYDEEMATLDLRVALGSDGRVRRFEVLSVREEKDNQFHHTPVRRWLSQLELALRGYRFGSGEVVARLLDAVFEGVRHEFPVLIQLFGDLEFYLGALGLADEAARHDLEVCLPELLEQSTSERRLEGLFNPLLLASGISPVPCSVATDRHDATLLITGPNSGGKTRLLQALGLSFLLAQAGLFVPARAAALAPAAGLVVSLIQETAVDQREGRLGMELLRIRGLFEQVPAGAVVILDELCSGTNPSEGEEIFELVLRMLGRLRPQAFITTHFLEFAARLEKEREIDGLRFLQVSLGERQEPTYQFVPGVATTSLASQAASRLGVTGDQLLALIDERLQRDGDAVD